MQNGYRIANLRIDHNISQKDMARILNLSFNTYRRIEDQVYPITLEKLNLISNMFDVSLDYLLGLTKNYKVFKKISNEIDYSYLRFSLKYQRRMKKVNQQEVAKLFKVSISTIRNYEKFAKNLSVTYLIKFAQRFNISIDYICGKTLQKEILKN